MFRRQVFFSLMVLLSSVVTHAGTYSFGVVPQQSAKKIARLWTPILAHINKKTGYTLELKTAKNIPTFEQRVALGQYDFSYMNPYHYTVFSKLPGYIAFAKRYNQKIKGIVVVHKDSPIQSLQNLQNNTLVFPSPAAFAASLLPRAKLKAENITFKPQYVSSHDSVYLNVAKGLFPAGGGVKRTFNNTNEDVRKQLRILWTTEAYTPHAFAAHPKVPADVRMAVQQAFIAMKNSPEGRSLLNSIKIKHGIVAAEDNDWNDVRSLNIGAL